MKPQIAESINNRFSPMIFEDKSLNMDQVNTVFEAGTLAASSYNAQPWMFIYGEKGTSDYEELRSLLSEYNQVWTADATILVLTLARHLDEKGEPNYFALYDLGQAVSSMAIQASHMGLQLHQMGGYDMVKAREVLNIPHEYITGSIFALGVPGDKSNLEGHFKERAHEPRMRKPITEISGGVSLFRKS
jgi:nitroreductase